MAWGAPFGPSIPRLRPPASTFGRFQQRRRSYLRTSGMALELVCHWASCRQAVSEIGRGDAGTTGVGHAQRQVQRRCVTQLVDEASQVSNRLHPCRLAWPRASRNGFNFRPIGRSLSVTGHCPVTRRDFDRNTGSRSMEPIRYVRMQYVAVVVCTDLMCPGKGRSWILTS
jgi:hypothetical protein